MDEILWPCSNSCFNRYRRSISGWVKSRLLAAGIPGLDEARILALPGGPEHVGPDATPAELAADRGVDVYVCRTVGP